MKTSPMLSAMCDIRGSHTTTLMDQTAYSGLVVTFAPVTWWHTACVLRENAVTGKKYVCVNPVCSEMLIMFLEGLITSWKRWIQKQATFVQTNYLHNPHVLLLLQFFPPGSSHYSFHYLYIAPFHTRALYISRKLLKFGSNKVYRTIIVMACCHQSKGMF